MLVNIDDHFNVGRGLGGLGLGGRARLADPPVVGAVPPYAELAAVEHRLTCRARHRRRAVAVVAQL